MARLIWTEPALLDIDKIAEYIAIDDPFAASCFIRKVFERVGRLEAFPVSGKRPPELPDTFCREVVVSPCRIFYRIEEDIVYILYVMRAERLLRSYLLDQRNREK